MELRTQLGQSEACARDPERTRRDDEARSCVERLADEEILRVSRLSTDFPSDDGVVQAVDRVDLALKRGDTMAIVGESGSGKSITCLSIMQLIDPPGRIAAGEILFRRRDGAVADLARLGERALRGVRGDEIAMIFQEPMTSLNPLYPVGDQIAEVIREHRGLRRKAAWSEAVELLRKVGIADPERRAGELPHQMSGGMRQRVMIAMALACNPLLLIADEPTTALDVTIQAQILDLMRALKRSAEGMSIIFVTHNMGVVAEIADRVTVMYAGQVVESGPVRDIFRDPRHPYTRGLLGSIRSVRRGPVREPLVAIPGNVPDPLDRPAGCAFSPRCGLAEDACRAAPPELREIEAGRTSRCHRWREM
jgi:oligopeptide/dipeptide ABC transporter ATP-binding protein